MPPPKPPSKIQPTSFPIFSLSWMGETPDTRSFIAYSGGGGSARTGVGNTIRLNDITIDTGDQICICVQLHPLRGMLACIADEVRLYDFEGTPVCAANCEGNGGVNCAAFSLCGERVVVGCENGNVLFFRLEEEGEFVAVGVGKGHTKAVCSVMVRQDLIECVSSAKDGTARVWDTENGAALAVLQCEIDVEEPKKKSKRPPRPVQILVRGCAYGEDGSIYTVASAKRGKAFIHRWIFHDQGYVVENRVCCSEYPISAMNISEDRYILALGGVDGTITLMNVETLTPLKKFQEVHDLPVTCIAARPLITAEEHLIVDAMSASADNKLAFLSMKREKMSWMMTIIILLIPILFGLLTNFFIEECAEEITTMSFDKCRECMVGSLIASSSRQGVMIPPF